jgi:endonuclease-8
VPEGDTIHLLAQRLARALVGKEVRSASAHTLDAASLVGRTIASVESRGKNLLVRFDDGRTLHVHLRMLGRLGVQRGPVRGSPQIRIDVDGATIVGRRIPVLRLLSPDGERRSPDLARLGPDLLASDFDETEALRRLRALGARPIGDALIVQSAVAGIGNIYKSEVLFLERVDPRTRVRDLDDATLLALLRRARTLLAINAKRGGPRRTRSSLAGPSLWVYDRTGKRCLVCGAAVARITQGSPGAPRSTYYCQACQR